MTDDASANEKKVVAARVVRATGLLGIYLTWGLLVWFIFAYGRLVYDQLGMGAEASFVRSWLVALGVDNAAQWRDILHQAIKGGIILIMLDQLWVMSNATWIEDHLDFLSVGATLLAEGAVTHAARLRTHLRFYAYVEA